MNVNDVLEKLFVFVVAMRTTNEWAGVERDA